MDLPEDEAIINLDAKASPTILANIFGCNISLLYQEANKGKLLPIADHTYREQIRHNRQYLIKNKELKIEQEANKQKLRELKEEKRRSTMSKSAFGGDDEVGMELMVAKTKQDIRVNMARELQIYVKTAIERGQYINSEELEELIDPFLTTIRQSLSTISLESEVAEKQVDLIMEQLYLIGTTLVDDAKRDSSAFVDDIMQKPIDPSSIELDREPPRIL